MSQARLKKVFHEALLVEMLTNVPTLDTIGLNVFINRFFSCFKSREYSNRMLPKPFAIILDPVRCGSVKDYLNPSNIIAFLSQLKSDSCNVLFIDFQGKRVKDAAYNDVVIDGDDVASGLSKADKLILFYINQLAIRAYVNGECVASTDNVHTLKRSGEIRNTDKPPSQYRDIINDHFKKDMLSGKRFGYWENKQNRILKQKPEHYFRDQLVYYFKNNLTVDGIVEKEAPVALTDDKIDIRITDTTNDSEYIFIEIKWMGKALSFKKDINKKGRDVKIRGQIEIGDESPNEGIHQLGIYLENETRAKCGSLVTYDARTMNNDINWNIDASEWHKKIDKPDLRLLIKSDSASIEAKKLAQKYKKKKQS